MSKTSQTVALNTALPRSSSLVASQWWTGAVGTVAQDTVLTSELVPSGPNASVFDAAANRVALAAPHDVGLQSTGSYIEGSTVAIPYNGATDAVSASLVFRVDTAGSAIDLFSFVDWTQSPASPIWILADGAGTFSVIGNRFHSSAVQIDGAYTLGTIHHVVAVIDYAAQNLTVELDGTQIGQTSFTRSGAAIAAPALVPTWGAPGVTLIKSDAYSIGLSAQERSDEYDYPYEIGGDPRPSSSIDGDPATGLGDGTGTVAGGQVTLDGDPATGLGDGTGSVTGGAVTLDGAPATGLGDGTGTVGTGDISAPAAAATGLGDGIGTVTGGTVSIDGSPATGTGDGTGSATGGAVTIPGGGGGANGRPLPDPIGAHVFFTGYFFECARYCNVFRGAVEISPGFWFQDVNLGPANSATVRMRLTWTDGTPSGSIAISAQEGTASVSIVATNADHIIFDATANNVSQPATVGVSGLTSHVGMDLRREDLVGQNLVFDPRYSAPLRRLRWVHFLQTNDESDPVASWTITILTNEAGRVYSVRDTETDTNIVYTAQVGDSVTDIRDGLILAFTAAGRTASALTANSFTALANGENYYDAPAGGYAEFWQHNPALPVIRPRIDWADRVTPNPGFIGYQPQASVEALVDEANALYAEGGLRSIWVNLFLDWSDAYNIEFLNYLDANLNPAIEVDVEMGNELWNSFPPFSKGYHVALAAAYAAGLYTLDGTPPDANFGSGIAQGERMAAAQASTIFSSGRTVRRQLGCFSGFRGATQNIIAGAINAGYGSVFDGIALGPYTNGSAGGSFDGSLSDADMVGLIETDQAGVVSEVTAIHGYLVDLAAGTLANTTPGASGNLTAFDWAMAFYETGVHYDVFDQSTSSLTSQRSRVIWSQELADALRPYYDTMFALDRFTHAHWFTDGPDNGRFVFAGRSHINSPGFLPVNQSMIDAGNAAAAAASNALVGLGEGTGSVTGGTITLDGAPATGVGEGVGTVAPAVVTIDGAPATGTGEGIGTVSGGQVDLDGAAAVGTGEGVGTVSGGAVVNPGVTGAGEGVGSVVGGAVTLDGDPVTGVGSGTGSVDDGTTFDGDPASGLGEGTGTVGTGTVTLDGVPATGTGDGIGSAVGGEVQTGGGVVTGVGSGTGSVSGGSTVIDGGAVTGIGQGTGTTLNNDFPATTPFETEADRLDLITCLGGIYVLVDGVQQIGIYEIPSSPDFPAQEVHNDEPTLLVLDTVGVVGSSVNINNVVYTVVAKDNDGTGMATLVLQR